MTVAQHKVLLIDDSEISLHFVAGVLTRAGYDVRTADEVDKISGVLGDWRPDVILTDVNMPNVSGLELCRMLKSNYETAHVPVVLFSALPNSEELPSSPAAGACAPCCGCIVSWFGFSGMVRM